MASLAVGVTVAWVVSSAFSVGGRLGPDPDFPLAPPRPPL